MKLKSLITPFRFVLGSVGVLTHALMTDASATEDGQVHPFSFVSQVNPLLSLQFMQPKLCDPDVVQVKKKISGNPNSI